MEPVIQSRILGGLAYAQTEAHTTSQRFGSWEKQRNMAEVFIKIHKDVAEALEVIAVGDGPSPRLKGVVKEENITRAEEKLADVIIRILDVAQGKGLRVGPAVVAKMEYNEKLSMVVRKDF